VEERRPGSPVQCLDRLRVTGSAIQLRVQRDRVADRIKVFAHSMVDLAYLGRDFRGKQRLPNTTNWSTGHCDSLRSCSPSTIPEYDTADESKVRLSCAKPIGRGWQR